MAKATVHSGGGNSTPSDTIVKDGAQIFETTDGSGRRITIQKPKALDRYRIMKMIGGENARNQEVLGYATLACSVRSISGDPVQMPNSERQIEVLIDRLGDEGLEAVASCLAEHLGINIDEDAVKN